MIDLATPCPRRFVNRSLSMPIVPCIRMLLMVLELLMSVDLQLIESRSLSQPLSQCVRMLQTIVGLLKI